MNNIERVIAGCNECPFISEIGGGCSGYFCPFLKGSSYISAEQYHNTPGFLHSQCPLRDGTITFRLRKEDD